MKFLKKLFSQPRLVIEIAAPLPILSKEDDEAIKTLTYHSGFVALHNKLKVQRALLRTKLETGHHTGDDVAFLQAGIFWSKFYEREVDALVNKRRAPQAIDPGVDIMAEFEKVNAQLERVK